MAEYIDIDAPIDVAVYQRNRRIQVTLRQILESNDAKYECSDLIERKKGKWVGRSENDCYPVCSECGRTRLGSSLGYCQKYVPFCEHCGADMRGEENAQS